jgi:hypothetical protein
MTILESCTEVLLKIKNRTPYDLANPFLCIYPKEMKSVYQRSIYTPMFITALFTITKKWK